MSRYLLKCAAILIYLLLGCTPTAVRRPPSLYLSTINDWPEAYRQNFSAIRHLQSRVRLSVESPEYSASFTTGFLYAAPDTLHLKAEGPFGLDLGEFFIGRERFILYNQFNNNFICGRLDDEFYNRFLETNLTLEQVKNVLVGYVPLPDNLRLADKQHGIFSAAVQNEKWRFRVNPAAGTLESWEILRMGQVVLKYEFDQYRRIGEIVLPALVRVINPARTERLSAFHKSIRLNEPLDPAQYRLVINSKVEQLMIDERK